MTPARCPRQWEVEAARDGRLSEPSVELLLTHARSCDACRHEASSLRALERRLRAEAVRPDDVSIRRLRHRILERADRSFRDGFTPRLSVRLVVAAAFTVVVAAAGVYAGAQHAAPAMPPAIDAPRGRDGARVAERVGAPPLDVGPPPPVVSSPAIAVVAPLPSRPKTAVHRRNSVVARAGGAPAVDESRAEDVAYLTVVALMREGRTEEARRGAADYVRRFPDGFRRFEMARIAR